MTKEEAVKILESKAECMRREISGTYADCNYRNCDDCELNYAQGTVGEQREAIQVAVEALQEPKRPDSVGTTDDLISRRAARHALCKAVHKDEDIPCENQSASCLWSKTRVCDYAREIDALPSVQSYDRKLAKVLADTLDGTPLLYACDKLWSEHGWCEGHCKAGQQEPDAECWMRYAEVMANE